ncbi:MAG: 5,10-methylenetetrahydrofolate reductase [Candidatus Lokiarchaeota archaeon]|nr:5,10-methylenetetrahydrofolate reductase [Candidatus Lokiarchaeota archaeon]
MIVTQKKEVEEIIKSFEPFNKFLVIGCSSCATKCQTGGEDQVKEMVELLKEKGKTVIASAVFEEPCDKRLTKKDYNSLKKENSEVPNADVAIIMSCGLGCQAFAEVTNHVIIPSNDTVFMGITEKLGNFKEYCKACGECVLGDTGGICPKTRCAKGLLNGPCGGVANGSKCEYGGYVNDCAWILIYNKLKEINQLNKYLIFHPPTDFLLENHPRKIPKEESA